MIRAGLYFTLLFIIQTSILRSQSLPDWIEEMPQDKKYYWAQESVSIRGLSEKEYKENVPVPNYYLYADSYNRIWSS